MWTPSIKIHCNSAKTKSEFLFQKGHSLDLDQRCVNCITLTEFDHTLYIDIVSGGDHRESKSGLQSCILRLLTMGNAYMYIIPVSQNSFAGTCFYVFSKQKLKHIIIQDINGMIDFNNYL